MGHFHSKHDWFGLPFEEGKAWLYLLCITLASFALQMFALFTGAEEMIIRLFALTPTTALSQPWTLVTAMFLHGGLLHILFNMFALFMFGPLLEQRIGSRRFLLLYFAAGILGNITYLLSAWGQNIPALGASGAIYGILGAMALLEPNLVIFMMFIPMPMWMASIAWVFLEFTNTMNTNSTIASWAHLGGLFAGFAYGYFLRSKARKFIEEYDYIEP